MVINIILLFLAAMVGGLFAYFLSERSELNIKYLLVFAGSFLFSITVIHILPELFSGGKGNFGIGLMVLAGFFMQQLLEYFSSGAEHGHIHVHSSDHHHNQSAAILVLGALSLHGLLEGTLLAHPSNIHMHHDAKALLIGIALHKIPAAFALLSILICYLPSRKTAIAYLMVFAIASPLGLIISDYLFEHNRLSGDIFVMLFALVSGNFLHISTTIVFESSPNHRFDGRRLITSLIGAGVAILAEQML